MPLYSSIMLIVSGCKNHHLVTKCCLSGTGLWFFACNKSLHLGRASEQDGSIDA